MDNEEGFETPTVSWFDSNLRTLRKVDMDNLELFATIQGITLKTVGKNGPIQISDLARKISQMLSKQLNPDDGFNVHLTVRECADYLIHQGMLLKNDDGAYILSQRGNVVHRLMRRAAALCEEHGTDVVELTESDVQRLREADPDIPYNKEK